MWIASANLTVGQPTLNQVSPGVWIAKPTAQQPVDFFSVQPVFSQRRRRTAAEQHHTPRAGQPMTPAVRLDAVSG